MGHPFKIKIKQNVKMSHPFMYAECFQKLTFLTP